MAAGFCAVGQFPVVQEGESPVKETGTGAFLPPLAGVNMWDSCLQLATRMPTSMSIRIDNHLLSCYYCLITMRGHT